MYVTISIETGALFELLVRLMQLEANSGTTVDYVPLVKLLGRYFQIRDDYQNLTSKQVSVCDHLYVS